jgi:hypothetical protein
MIITKEPVIVVCDLRGGEIEILVDGFLPGRKHQTQWNSSKMEGGMYISHFKL